MCKVYLVEVGCDPGCDPLNLTPSVLSVVQFVVEDVLGCKNNYLNNLGKEKSL